VVRPGWNGALGPVDSNRAQIENNVQRSFKASRTTTTTGIAITNDLPG